MKCTYNNVAINLMPVIGEYSFSLTGQFFHARPQIIVGLGELRSGSLHLLPKALGLEVLILLLDQLTKLSPELCCPFEFLLELSALSLHCCCVLQVTDQFTTRDWVLVGVETAQGMRPARRVSWRRWSQNRPLRARSRTASRPPLRWW